MEEMSVSGWGRAAMVTGACLCITAVPADEFDLRGYGAGLYVGRDETGIANEAAAPELQADRIGIRFSERVSGHLVLGLQGGIVTADMAGQALTGGMDLTGNFLGMDLSGTILAGGRWNLDYRMGLAYQTAKDESDGLRIELDWLESALSFTLGLAITDAVSIYAGSRFRKLELDQRASGDINETTEFAEQDRVDALAGVVLEVDPGGFIEMAVHRGAGDGFTLEFSREY
ncbi:MAG: hypothetical protein AB7K73_06065 [Gammaproteobacteria bacterium]